MIFIQSVFLPGIKKLHCSQFAVNRSQNHLLLAENERKTERKHRDTRKTVPNPNREVLILSIGLNNQD